MFCVVRVSNNNNITPCWGRQPGSEAADTPRQMSSSQEREEALLDWAHSSQEPLVGGLQLTSHRPVLLQAEDLLSEVDLLNLGLHLGVEPHRGLVLLVRLVGVVQTENKIVSQRRL